MGLLIKPHAELHNKCQTGMPFRSTKLKCTSKCQWMSVIMIYGAFSQITMKCTLIDFEYLFKYMDLCRVSTIQFIYLVIT